MARDGSVVSEMLKAAKPRTIISLPTPRPEVWRGEIKQTEWFKEFVKDYGEEPDLDSSEYDYKRAWEAGARPDTRDPTDNNKLHWPSIYKGDNHPRRIIDGVDTRSGRILD